MFLKKIQITLKKKKVQVKKPTLFTMKKNNTLYKKFKMKKICSIIKKKT